MALCLTASPALGQDDRAIHLATFDEVWTLVRDTHFDPDLGGVDWEGVRDELRPRAAKASSQAALRGVLNDMLSRLGQSHFAVVSGGAPPPPGQERELPPPGEQTWDSGLGFAVHLVDGEPRVASVEPDSAVGRAGVEAGWGITKVGETPVPPTCETTCEVNFPLLRASGPEVVVEFVGPGAARRAVRIPLGPRRSRRYEFEGMPVQETWILQRLLDEDIGYIAFGSFFDPVLVVGQFEQALRSFAKAEGLIIDVRGNTGGMGEMALTMIGWFTGGKRVPVGTMIAREGELVWYTGPRQLSYERPVAVLIDGRSGSSAEVFAAGMRDVGGARLFGQATAGAVLPSVFDPLPNGDSLLHAIANYVTVEGVELEGPGVVPDVETEPRRGTDLLDDEALWLAIDWILGNS